MIVSAWGIWGMGVFLAILSGYVITRFSRTMGDTKIAVGCYSSIILTVLFSIALTYVAASVVVVKQNNGEFEYETKRAFFRYEGHSVALCSEYIDNRTTEHLVLYPVYYGDANSSDVSYKDVQLFQSNTFEKLLHTPDHYFYEPSSIYTRKKDKVVCEWILESATKVFEKAETERQRKQNILNKLYK
ncbi:MAG: hypothetical protein K2J00_05700 [Bacteroidaceae bacterium]|nr:hypothetical protein [Bacteroidaceae bacterium]